MNGNNRKKRKKKVLILFLFFCGLILLAVIIFQKNDKTQSAKWMMKKVIVYDTNVKQEMERLLEDGLDVLFWKEDKSDTVINLDYNRSIEVKTMGVAGDASILFPNSNGLPAGETGYCILGENTAWQLFGSTRIIGRRVAINGENYQVAGIEYQEKELCVYELSPDKSQEIAYAAISSKSREQVEMDKRKVEMVLDISLNKISTHDILSYNK
ncbi:MAG: ABC transporter permease [Lachnospiraceae bacterium]|nr:ABC transporter permease [Lachnospiraceae bacterium]